MNTVLAGIISVTDEDRGANAKLGFLGFDCDAVSISCWTSFRMEDVMIFMEAIIHSVICYAMVSSSVELACFVLHLICFDRDGLLVEHQTCD